MKIRGLLLVAAALGATSSLQTARSQSVGDLRVEAQSQLKAGNFRDALAGYRKLVLDPREDPGQAPADFQNAVRCLSRLGRYDEIDSLRDEAIRLQAGNWRFLRAAADSFLSGQRFGYIVADKFYRGNHRGGGEYVSSAERDRVRALQLMMQAMPLLKAESNQPAVADFDLDLARQILNGRTGGTAWKLQILTDLSKLPDYEHAQGYLPFRRGGGGGTVGAPVDSDGNPVFYHVPPRLEAAQSDGERWRWALAQAVEASPQQKYPAALILANFLHGEFGVQTLAGFGRFPEEDDDQSAATGPFAVHTLKEDETIARLATGIKRFKLPDEFNFLRIYRDVATNGNNSQAQRALTTLATIFENRRQYPRAADAWRECIRRFGLAGHDDRQKRLDQIVGNWGQFQHLATQPAELGRTLGFRFRNGKRLDLEAHAIHVDKLLDDVKAYLKSNPARLDWNQVNIGDIGKRLLDQNESQYFGERVAQWSVPLEPSPIHFDRSVEIAVPFQKAGAYFITAKLDGGNTSRLVLWLADTAIVKKQLAAGAFYYVADAVSGAPIAGANVEFFGYRQENVGRNQFRIHTANFAETSDGNGQVFPDPKDLERQYEWLAIARTPQGRLAFLGFEGIWYGASDPSRYDQRKAFVITDRPVYRPGQTVKFKFWVREARYDAPSVSIFAGQTFKVRVSDPQGQTVLEKSFTADAYGGFDGEIPLSADATLGVYNAAIVDRNDVSGGGNFRVEEYKKPEFEVTVDAPREPALLGDKITATVNAKYYFGGPVTQASVHYKVTRTTETARWYPFGIWDWCYGPGYWWFWPASTWHPGWHRWGFAPPRPSWLRMGFEPPEVVLDATVPISSDGTLKIEIDTAAAKALHGNTDHRYDITAEVVDESRRTIVGSGHVLVARKPFQVVAWTDRGYYQAGGTIHASFHAQTLDHKPVTGKGVATLFRVTYDAAAKPTETAEQTWNLDPDAQGSAKLQIDASKGGQYRLSYQVTDGKQRAIEGAVLLTIFGSGTDTAKFRFNHLELIPDQREYAPGGKVRLLINTQRADSTVVLFVRALDGVYPKPQIVRLHGKSTVVEIAVAHSDMPNFFVEAFTVSDAQVHSETREIVVPPEKRVLNVAVLPSAHDFKPGAEARVTLKLTDLEGKPAAGSIVLSAYDKSVEYVSAGTNVPEIREFFWKWQRTHYPQGSSSLDRVSYNLLERNETPMRQIGVFGQLAEQSYPRAPGAGRRGHSFDARSQDKSPAPMARAVAGAAVIEEERQSSAAAPSAEVEPTVRTQFADTAFWAARIEADPDGVAAVSFPMPENLTTWEIRGWAMGAGTRVGQGDAEVLTTKNLLVRMQAPRFFVEKDEVVLSAIVHNHLKTNKSVRVILEMDGKTLEAIDGAAKTLEVSAGGEMRVDWRVKAMEHGEAVIRMKALTDEESDAVQMSFPVRIHGMLKTESYAGSIRADRESASFKIAVPAERRINDTRLEIRYSPTLAGAMVDALPYLVSYPHDTTDCTLYRFLPTVITQNILKRMNLDLAAIKAKRANLNAQELGDAAKRAAGWKRFDDNPVFDNAEVDRLVKRGVKALTEMQLSDGGWGWFSGRGEHSEPHMTAQIVHGLQLARQNGVALVPGVLERGVEWLKVYQAQQVVRLKNGSQEKPVEPNKKQADNVDALVYMVLVDADVNDAAMQDFLYRDRVKLSVYAKGLFGLALSTAKAAERLAMIVQNIDQYLVQDDENQTAWLRLPEGVFWWFWYDNESEANAFYLKLLARTDPKGEKASRLAKYLLNNRKHAAYWNSPRDTAFAIEALAEFVVASGEDRPELTVEVYVDGKKLKEAAINAKNLFTFDDKAEVIGDALASGPHNIELKKRGKGPLYFNAYLTNFTLEDPIRSAGLEIKVARAYFKLVRDDQSSAVAGGHGQVVRERTEKYRRVPLHSGDEVKSGDLIEIELTIDSKNDYEHLIFEDPKAAGIEPYDVQSGYNAGGLGAYVQLRDEKVTLFLRSLARGKHSLHYRMRAEIPGRFSALPTLGSGMYAPELKGNSDEMKVLISD